MKSLKNASLLLVLVLTACSSSDDTQNVVTHNQTDNPQVRMNAVLNHGYFSQLVQEPDCRDGSLRLTVFEGTYGGRDRRDSYGPSYRDSRRIFSVFIDSRYGLLTLAQWSVSGNHSEIETHTTSLYSVSGDRLTIEDYGTIEVGRRGTLSLSIPSRQIRVGLSRSGDKVFSSDSSQRIVGSSSDVDFYRYICGGRPARRRAY